MEPNDVGTIKFPSDRDSGGMYGPNMNCYFKIIVSPGKKVKIVFKDFNLQSGVDYGITNFPGYSDNYLFGKSEFNRMNNHDLCLCYLMKVVIYNSSKMYVSN